MTVDSVDLARDLPPNPAAAPAWGGGVVRRVYALLAWLAGLAAVVLVLMPAGRTAVAPVPLAGALLAYAAWCGWTARVGHRRGGAPGFTLFAAAAGAIGGAGALGLAFGADVRHPGLGLAPLLVALLCALGGRGWGAALAALTLAAMLGVTLALDLSWLWVGAQALVLALAVLAGRGVARLLARQAATIAAHEARWHSWRSVAADLEWESDAQFRYTRVVDADDRLDGAAGVLRLDATPWEIEAFELGEDAVDALRADMEAHLPITDLLLTRRDAGRPTHSMRLSGEARYADDGSFAGYWGVGRDVSAELRWRDQASAAEARFRDLFERSPSPLVLLRKGMVLDANDAAVRMFGFSDLEAMHGFMLATLYPDGPMRESATRRAAQLEEAPVGESVPVADHTMHALNGRVISVQSTGVRVDIDSGPALLGIYFDSTGRKAVELALRRSETMLLQLFATVPDVMTLADLATDRYTMVNPSFSRLFGHASHEALGRTATELGLWSTPGDRERLLEALGPQGSVRDLRMVLLEKSGRPVTMRLSAARFTVNERDYLVVSARDVTETERAELEHQAILQRASVGIAFTRRGAFVRANSKFERMLGWEPDTLPGQPGSVVWRDADEYAEVSRIAIPLFGRGEALELEREVTRRDGSRFWARIRAQVVDPNDPGGGGTVWIAEDITERRQIEQALAAARDAAEAANRAKSAFLANTSHEIRTPLNGLLGLARLAMQPQLEAARRQQYLAQIFDSAQSLAAIISDILDLSKIEAGKVALEHVAFGLREMVTAVHHAYRALADVKGLEMALVIDEDVPATVGGDPVRLRQILGNFVSNALKFTERGRIVLAARRGARDLVRLSVTDTGPGIDAPTRARLFQPFMQADESTTRRYGGTGLGLSICRELALLMGGSVGVDSEPGRGATFWVELPLQALETPAGVIDSGFDDLQWLQGAHVLMAEDNPVNMMIAVAMLEDWGVHVAQATDGAMAVAAVEAAMRGGRPFDAVLMDVHMPVMSGHAAVRTLRERYAAQTLPIIALTAAALVSERDEALAAGMNDFLTKPVDARRLRKTLARHLRRIDPPVSD
ncbi:MAG: PAS domain S-box protein [Burkholderiaceae bacterium]